MAKDTKVNIEVTFTFSHGMSFQPSLIIGNDIQRKE
jgi:hypothetical protein